MQTTVEQLAKLPRYAREDLQNLQRQVADLQRMLDQMSTEANEPTLIKHGRPTQYVWFPIPDNHTVTFEQADGLQIRVRLDNEGIKVIGDEWLTVAPSSPNVVLIMAQRSNRK